jgi:DNA-binding winged helix-turn-helix (wHTH) protein
MAPHARGREAARRRVLLIIDLPDTDETPPERVLPLVNEFGTFVRQLVPGGSAWATIAPVVPQPSHVTPPWSRRTGSGGAEGLNVDQARREVSIAGSTVDLTYKEFELLAYLSANPRRVISRAELIKAIWGIADDSAPSERVIDVHIRRLRGKLGHHRSAISTVRGEGYRFDPRPYSQLRDRSA